VDLLDLAVLGRSRKENERRLPLHPRHLERIHPDLRGHVYLEQGYGDSFGIGDDELAPHVAGLRGREELLDSCDVVLLPKPLLTDVHEMRDGQTLWGWPHCVQDAELTQAGIDKRLTIIAWEAMNHWAADGSFERHVFSMNNQLAGYASVLHALELLGLTGHYGRELSAAVIGSGATGLGAVTALNGLGVVDVAVFTHRDVSTISAPAQSVQLQHVSDDPDSPGRVRVCYEDGAEPLSTVLAGYDVVVNCVLQDTDRPLLFLTEDDLRRFRAGSLIVDVSCDTGMGFSWAKPTSFADPLFVVGDNISYYAVDHSPSLLWDSATWEVSEAVLPYLRPVMAGPAGCDGDETVRRAIEMRAGVVQNPRILSFQHRAADYPHERASSETAQRSGTNA
jgi:alanine dehydrogenase